MKMSRVQKLEEKIRQQNEMLKKAKARERDLQRKLETRGKIIAGGFLFRDMSLNMPSEIQNYLYGLINKYAKQTHERKAINVALARYDLPLIPEDPITREFSEKGGA